MASSDLSPRKPVVFLISDTSIDETRNVGGGTGYLRALASLGRSEWAFATPRAALPAAQLTPHRQIDLGPPLEATVVPKRLLFPLRVLRSWRRLRGADVHYHHSNEAAMLLLTWPLRRLVGSPIVVIHQHGASSPLARPTFRWGENTLVRRLYDAALRWAHRKADLVVAIDDACVAKNAAWGVRPERVIKIPNAVDLSLFRFDPEARLRVRRRMNLAENTRVIVHVGRLERIKRQTRIVDAVAQLRNDGKQVTLVIAGSGSMEQELRQQVQNLGLSDHIQLVGVLSQQSLTELYCASDCLVLASEIEGVPMVILEATACGTPVVSTSVGGVPEVVSAASGVLVGPDPSTAELAKAISQCLEAGWDRQSVEREASRFGVEATATALDAAFEEALGRRDRRRR